MAERPCTVCQHPSRLAIDQAILNGKGLRAIARDFRIGRGEGDDFVADHKKVQRHRDRCMGEAYRAAKDADLEASGLALVNRMKELDEVVDEVLRRLRAGTPLRTSEGLPITDPNGDPVTLYEERTLLRAVAEARRNVDMRAKLAGALPEGDAEGLERQRELLQNPAVRRLMAELDELLAKDDQELPG